MNRERPSAHGQLLGKALARLAATGREQQPTLPDPCLTCAFREGCMTNQMAATGTIALNCVLGIDPDDFACHHGMKEGQPTKLCVGYMAAKLAPFHVTKEVLGGLAEQLASLSEQDEVRRKFDAWASQIDPDGTMDDYERSRAYARSFSGA